LSVEMYAIIIVSAFFAGAYALGSRLNYRIQKRIWGVLSKELKSYCRSVRFQGFGSSGFRVVCKPVGAITKLEVTVALLTREMPLYLAFLRLKRRRDRVVVKSNFSKHPTFHVEIIRKGSPTEEKWKHLVELKEVELTELADQFSVKASSTRLALRLLSDRDLLSGLKRLSKYVERLSITRKEPHLLLVCAADVDIIQPLMRLVAKIGNRMAIISGK